MEITKLFQQACPSIQYRIRKEILHDPIQNPTMQNLQKQILNDPLVRQVSDWQQPDGWIGKDFHGENSLETGIRILCEKGVESSNPIMSQALKILSKEDERLNRGIGKAGITLDKNNLGGTQLIRAVVFAYAGMENLDIVQNQIEKALVSFQTPATIQTIEDVTTTHKGKLVYHPGTVWPSIYHLRLLAFTKSWRTEENLRRLKDGVNGLVKLSPLPYVLLKHVSQLVAPASFCMLDFNPDLPRLTDAEWLMWFHRMELLARTGILLRIPELYRQVSYLKEWLQQNGGKFTKELSHLYFRKWGAYSGLMLEQNWRTSNRRINDLTFRSLLILHYSNLVNLAPDGTLLGIG